MQLIIINYFNRPLNLDSSRTYFAKTLVFCVVAVYFTVRRGVAQPGSASALGAEGRRFESVHPDQYSLGPMLSIKYCFIKILVLVI